MKHKPYLHKKFIDSRALKIVQALQARKFTTYLVGGCVRDLLLGLQPKDFDIGTIARPQQVKKTVPQSYIIGKRFRLVLAKREEDLFEIATFRKLTESNDEVEDLPFEDNSFGSPEQDAKRRDFTINGLFYDPFDEQLMDYCNGIEDLKNRIIRMIGDPVTRILEDPIRTLRCIRLAHKINFSIEPELRNAMRETASSLETSALPRRREEFLKFLRVKDPSLPFAECFDLGIMKYISPTLQKLMENPEKSKVFLQDLRNLHKFNLSKDQPFELFGALIRSFVRLEIHPQLDASIKSKTLIDNPILKTLMRDELGMFNYEQDYAVKALQLQTNLKEWVEFQNRGERRRFALLKNDSFPLALLFADMENSLPKEAWDFWLESYEEVLPEIIEQDRQKIEDRGKNKKAPRRRKRIKRT